MSQTLTKAEIRSMAQTLLSSADNLAHAVALNNQGAEANKDTVHRLMMSAYNVLLGEGNVLKDAGAVTHGGENGTTVNTEERQLEHEGGA